MLTLLPVGRRAFGLCALLLSSLLAQTPEQVERSRQAKELMAAGRYAEAVPLYADLVKQVPGNPGLMMNLGMALHMAGRDAEAISEFDEVLKIQPGVYPALMMKAVSHMRLAEPAKAVPAFEKALAVEPKDMEARRMLADALLMLGRFDRAAAQLQKLTAATPQDPKVWYGLGRAYEQLAQNAFDKLLKTAPNSPYTIALTAEARLRQGRFQSAFALYKQAAGAPGVHAGLAELYEKTGHADWAATERAKISKPNCAKPSMQCNFEAGKHAAVVQAAKVRPSPEALFWQIRAYNEMALEAFQKLSALPPSAESHEVLAELHRNQGRYKESVAAWEEALKLSPGEPRLQRELATTVYAGREYARAEALLQQELRRDPKSPDLHFMLGDAILNQQRPKEAIDPLRRAVELDPKYINAHASLARAYTQAGEPEKAIPHLERSLAVDTDGALHYQLARAYQAAGRSEEARKLLARYQELQNESAAEPEITAP